MRIICKAYRYRIYPDTKQK
ncbi:MAG: helix-turn-helix domain-containing protein [cyanobacterium endosymbiont of Rhopalodia inflata]